MPLLDRDLTSNGVNLVSPYTIFGYALMGAHCSDSFAKIRLIVIKNTNSSLLPPSPLYFHRNGFSGAGIGGKEKGRRGERGVVADAG